MCLANIGSADAPRRRRLLRAFRLVGTDLNGIARASNSLVRGSRPPSGRTSASRTGERVHARTGRRRSASLARRQAVVDYLDIGEPLIDGRPVPIVVKSLVFGGKENTLASTR